MLYREYDTGRILRAFLPACTPWLRGPLGPRSEGLSGGIKNSASGEDAEAYNAFNSSLFDENIKSLDEVEAAKVATGGEIILYCLVRKITNEIYKGGGVKLTLPPVATRRPRTPTIRSR